MSKINDNFNVEGEVNEGIRVKPRIVSVCAYLLSYLAVVGFALFVLFAIVPYFAVLIYPYVFIISAPYLVLSAIRFFICCNERYTLTNDSLYLFKRLKFKK